MAASKLATEHNCLSRLLQGDQVDLAILDVQNLALVVIVVRAAELKKLSFEE